MNNAVAIQGQYVIFQDFEVRSATASGILVWESQHVQVRHNTIHGSTGYGVIITRKSMNNSSIDVEISGNTIYDNHFFGVDTTYVSGVTLANNIVYDNHGLGFDINISDHIVVKGNTFHDNGVEIYINNITNSTFEGNFIYASHTKGAHAIQLANENVSPSNPLNNNKIINNLAVGVDTGFFYGRYGKGGGLKNTLVANNTFSGTTGNGMYVESDAGHTNTLIVNNIFTRANNGLVGDVPQSPGLSFKNNTWWGGTAGRGASSSDVNKNPLFIHPGTFKANDYTLQPSSPDRNHGMFLAAVARDFAGQLRPSGRASSIGAYQ